MAITEPLVFEPIVKSQVWGGEFLKCRSSKAPDGPCGESWEIADHGADTTVIKSGEYADKTLHEVYAEVCGKGIDPASPEVFPLLLKIIDPMSDLSVQVHPDDTYAGKQKAGELGKTEAWYILEAEPGSKIYRGLKPGVSKSAFADAINNGTCAEMLKEVPVKAGDVAYLPSGTIHALCGGVRIAEIQQNSDTTYRVFDWNRVGLDGKPRELHVDHALAVSDFTGNDEMDLCLPQQITTTNCTHESFIHCEKFAFERLSNFSGVAPLSTGGERFNILTVVSGSATVTSGGKTVELGKYDSCLIPADAGEYSIEAPQDAAILRFYRP